MAERCPRCGLRFEREPGSFVGAVGMNTVVSFVLLLIVLVVGVALTYPDPPVVPLLVVCVGTAVVFPAFFYPFSKTLWVAVELAMTPLEPGEVDAPYGPARDDGTRPGGRDRPTSA